MTPTRCWIVFQDTPERGLGGVVVFSASDAERVAAGQRRALAFRFGREVHVWVEEHSIRSVGAPG